MAKSAGAATRLILRVGPTLRRETTYQAPSVMWCVLETLRNTAVLETSSSYM